MTSGTNWSNANLPTIAPDDKAAATKTYDYVTHYTSDLIDSESSITEAMLRSFAGTNSLKSHVSGLNVLSADALKDRKFSGLAAALKQISLIAAIEAEFGIRFNIKTALTLHSVSAIISAVRVRGPRA